MMVWIVGIVATLGIVGTFAVGLGHNANTLSQPVIPTPANENILQYAGTSLNGVKGMITKQPEVSAPFVVIVLILGVVVGIIIYRLLRRG